MPKDTIVATLIRGKKYTIFAPGENGKPGVYHEFNRNVPVEVSEELAALCEAEVEMVRTTDKENPQDVEMDRFKVERGAEAPVQPVEKPRMKLRLAPAKEPIARQAAPERKVASGSRLGGLKVGQR